MESKCQPRRRKSRYGCRNCKLRKLKCDEGKPQCSRCRSFGVVCNFSKFNVPDLQPVVADGAESLPCRRRPCPRPPLTSAVWTSDASSSYQLTPRCQDFLSRYLWQSLITPNDPAMAQVNRSLFALTFTVHHPLLFPVANQLISMSCQYPFLMHASIAVALAHDRHLNQPPGGHRSVDEHYHWTQSTILFSRRMREPIKPQDRDAIWGTAAALVVLSLASPDSRPPDVEWLRMNRGKMSLWRLTDPLRTDSLFRVLAPTYAQILTPLPERGAYGVPSTLAAVCGLDESSTVESNPYFGPAHAVSLVLGLPDAEVSTGLAGLFTGAIRGPFQDLVLEKDPAALLLLYLWFRKTGRSVWWIGLRASVECPWITSYLRLRCPGNCALQECLEDDFLDNTMH